MKIEAKQRLKAAGRPQWAAQILKYFNLLKLHQTTDETKLVFFAEASTYVLGIGLVKIAAILKQHELQISIAPESARAVLVTIEPVPAEMKRFMN
jgi:predicted anti-sigma-YlaC factor YlaD